jgi:DNA-binding PadR family transcriptional regulator
MSLPHAILGFLNVMPMTGYDLKTQAFDRSVAHFWPAVQPQIYRDLARLEAAGHVRSETEVQRGKPNRRVYHITPAGRTELDRWLRTTPAVPGHREPFLIQLFFGAGLTNSELTALLQAQRAGHQARLDALQAVTIPPPAPAEVRRQTLTRLTLDLGLHLERAYLNWLDDALRTVAALDPAPAPAPMTDTDA